MQPVKHSLNLLQSALRAGSFLVFVRDPLRPFPIRFPGAGAPLMSVDIAKASGPVSRLRMFPNTGHVQVIIRVITVEDVWRNPGFSAPSGSGLKWTSADDAGSYLGNRGFESLTVHHAPRARRPARNPYHVRVPGTVRTTDRGLDIDHHGPLMRLWSPSAVKQGLRYPFTFSNS